jgi:formylglycine-generating enzyme required for sulfatase activity
MPTPPDHSVTQVALPERFGPYRIVRRLGRGGMGSVYLAMDTRLNRTVALKVCDRALRHPQALARFRTEAQAAAALRHPNLCPVYECDVRDGVPYLTMAYIEGPNLADWAARRGPLPPREAAQLVRKLALAMQTAHEHRVVHRDLKPSNVVLERGEPIVLDFGLARQATEDEIRLTRKGAVLGTPAYMAPEQAAGDLAEMGPSCDIYSLGVILFELLTGRPPFSGPPTKVLANVLCAAPPRPCSLRPEIDPQLEAICLKALAKRPSQRHASMADLAASLAAFAQPAPDAPRDAEAPTFVSPEDTVLPATERPTVRDVTEEEAESTSRTKLSLLIALGLALVLLPALGVGLVWLVNAVRQRGEEQEQAARKPADPGPDTPRPPRRNEAAEAPREVVNSVRMRLVRIPAGQFLMGSPKEEKEHRANEEQHRVEITRPFYMGATLVTQEQYQRVTGINPSEYQQARGGGPDYPVEKVSWYDAVAFCKRLSELAEEREAERVYRLPTEAEWEYACRAGTTTPFHFGATLTSDDANFDGRYPYGDVQPGVRVGKTTPAMKYRPNAWGLYDMHGNLWEWCQDWYDSGYYAQSPKKDPQGPEQGTNPVLRGGCWGNPAQECRSAARLGIRPRSFSDPYIGFRVVMQHVPRPER